MAQENDILSGNKNRYESINIDLDKLFEAKSQCEQCISILGTEQDTFQFRKTMTSHIRDGTSLCRSIKSNFNKITDIHNQQIQTLQQTFISLHSELKDVVNQIKIKSKQYEPHKAQINDSDKRLLNVVKAQQQREENDEYEKVQLNKLQQDLDDMKQAYDNNNDNNNDNNIVVKHVLKEGWLDKKSRYLKSWRRRWVVLDMNTEDITLFTFKQKKDYIHPTERLIINDDIDIQLNHTTHDQFTIYNISTKYKFVFKASDRQNRKAWIQILQNEQKKANNPITPTPNMQNIQNIQNIVIHPTAKQNANINVNIDININNNNNDDNKHYDLVLNGSHNQFDNKMEVEPGAELEVNTESETEPETEPGAAPKGNIIEAQPTEIQVKLQNKVYDKSNGEVQDCLLLIDDLTHLRKEEDVNSENNRIIIDFENSLRDKGFVTKDQIDKLRDVAIKLIGFMFDQFPMSNT